MKTQRLQRSVRATLLGLATNTLLVTAKFAAGWLGHSQALIADAVESLADILSSLIVWRGLVVAETPADEEHPYGHGKAEAIAAVLVSGLLFFAAGGIAYHSLEGLQNPRPAPAVWTLPVLVVVVAAKETLFRLVRRLAKTLDSPALAADAWHHRSDAITSVAAFIGIGIAVWGGRGYETADNWAALAAALVIGFNGVSLLTPAFDELMDRAPDRELIEQVRLQAQTIPGVGNIDKCHVRKMGWHLFVDIHVRVDAQMTVERSHAIAHQVKDRLREHNAAIRDVLVHIEPLYEQPNSGA